MTQLDDHLKSRKVRLSLEVDPEVREAILKLRNLIGAVSMTEAIRRAVYRYLEELEDGE